VHTLQHLSFFVTALLFWNALFVVPRQRSGVAVLYLFTTTVHTSVLGALITFASDPWYASYLERSALYGLSALEDQQLGGLIMWVPCSLVYLAAALILLGRWLDVSRGAVVDGAGR
jgi:cytochrome c oxidase assembly factor CtaG